ncbi:MAG TPA: hypothetical protein VJJ82_00180, partial [Candidatus Nanoarchaeia archaeon]|nr:hypothetical protein [Candidatus Nanoarchaeia archaeon]
SSNTTGTNSYANLTYRTGFGDIRFPQNVTYNQSIMNITQLYLNISSNNATLNATNLSWLNRTAFVTLRVSLVDPTPLFDVSDSGVFVDCPASRCTEVSYSANAYIFNVTGFSAYSSNETPIVLSGGSNSGGSSGSTGSTGSTASTSMTAQSTTQSMRTNDKVSFSVNNVQHSMTVTQVTTSTVTVRVASVPQTVVLKKGDVRELSLDNDLIPDFRITVLDLFQGKATLKLEKLEKPKAQTPVPPVTSSKPISEPTSAPGSSVGSTPVTPTAPAPAVVPVPAPIPRAQPDLVMRKTNGSSIWVPVVIIVVLVIAGLALLKGKTKRAMH